MSQRLVFSTMPKHMRVRDETLGPRSGGLADNLQQHVHPEARAEESWQQHLRLVLRAEIKHGFDSLSTKLTHELQALFSQEAVRRPEHANGHRCVPAPDIIDEDSSRRLPVDGFTQPPETTQAQAPSQCWESLAQSCDPYLFRKGSWQETIAEDVLGHEKSLHTRLHSIISELDRKSAANRGLAGFVMGRNFALLTFFAISANALWMGYDSNLQLHQLVDDEVYHENVSRPIRWAFTSWFIFELFLRLVCLRKYFFYGHERYWNFFDAFLVLSSIPEFFETSTSMSFLRLLRLLKLTKALRLMRLVKFIRYLRELLFSLFHTLGCLSWCFVALLLLTYMFAIIFLQTISNLLERGIVPSDLVMDNFSSIGQAMLSLFSIIAGGQDWYQLMQEFQDCSTLSVFLVVFYVFFMTFGLVNVIIGVFCAKAAEASAHDTELRMAHEDDKNKTSLQQAIRIFHEMDCDGDGRVDRFDFLDYLKTSKARGMPGFHGLQFFEIHKLWHVMMMFSRSQDGSVDLPGFVMSILRFAGEASYTENVMMSVQIEHIGERLERALNALDQLLQYGSSRQSLDE